MAHSEVIAFANEASRSVGKVKPTLCLETMSAAPAGKSALSNVELTPIGIEAALKCKHYRKRGLLQVTLNDHDVAQG